MPQLWQQEVISQNIHWLVMKVHERLVTLEHPRRHTEL